jgi:hypothetical protein
VKLPAWSGAKGRSIARRTRRGLTLTDNGASCLYICRTRLHNLTPVGDGHRLDNPSFSNNWMIVGDQDVLRRLTCRPRIHESGTTIESMKIVLTSYGTIRRCP